MDIFRELKYKFLDLNRDIKAKYHQTLYDINGGFVCKCCGDIIPTTGNEIQAKINGKNFMLTSYHTGARCYKCTNMLISQYITMTPLLNRNVEDFSEMRVVYHGKCDWINNVARCIYGISKHNNETAKLLDLDIRIGQGWWNGFKASQLVFNLAAQGEYTASSYQHLKNGKVMMSCGMGVMCEVKGTGIKING